MQKRINVSLPEETVRVLNRVVSKGERSRFIDHAILSSIEGQSKSALRDRLAEGYKRRAKDTLALAEEWFPIDEEAWRKSGV